MTTYEEVSRIILTQAEKQILHLKNQIEEDAKTFSKMAENELALEKQIISLNSQIEQLDELLEDSNEKLSSTEDKISKVRDAITDLKLVSVAALKQVGTNSSKAQFAVTLCELAIKTKLTNEVQFLEEAKLQIEELRKRLKP
ncbi:hypothetical protein [Magnetovibrio blakemorei]|uniref:Uncharacterized protein n=1 Tax=Magnetovibrio blakemorei TaxID=28181 RepID=A0A1E5Q4U7_9PROT|nr:hypothetical protein [Magnetovibrio blakemorei]OEJ65206.1 hypothetical protein BEN30_15145 [Magnetovibrio blakemorei]